MSAFIDAFSTAMQRRPWLLQLVIGVARRISPVWVVGKSAIALDSDAVREVFERGNDFELGPVGDRKMLMGRFLLGMDPRGDYFQERELLGDLLKRLQGRLSAIARKEADRGHAELAAKIARDPEAAIEVVGEFVEPVVTRIVSEFFGVPFPPLQQRSRYVHGSGEQLLAAWLRKVGSVIASTSPAPFGLQRIAKGCLPELCVHVDAEIEDRRARFKNGDRKVDVLDSLLALESAGKLDPSRVRPNLAGMILAGSAPIMKSFVCALRQLSVKRPCGKRKEAHWQPAIAAADRASKAATASAGEQELRELLFEAMRFAPTFPVLVRYCPRDTALGEGERARKIAAGSTVYAVPFAAMFDDAVEDAETFSAPRPTDQYLHFGSGQHECLGRDVATTALTEMLRAFFTLRGMDRRKPGRIRYDGPAVHRCRIRVGRGQT